MRGVDAEQHVATLLERDGWSVVARNWKGGGAELDLVARRGDVLRFVEVKARTDDAVDPLESITPAKQRKLVRGAEAWMAQMGAEAEDIGFTIAVVDLADEAWPVTFLDDAFDA